MDNKNFNNDQHLNYEELLAYHKGHLSNKEMHRLELHLVDCSLCKEALEGLTNLEEIEFEKHLSNIIIKTGTKKEGGISSKQILAIAASIILIAVVSIVVFNLKDNTPLIAEHQTDNTEQVPLKEQPVINKDTVTKNTYTVPLEQAPEEKISPVLEPQTSNTEPALAKQDTPKQEDTAAILIGKEDVTLAEIVNEEKPDSIIALADKGAAIEEPLAVQPVLAESKEQNNVAAARSKKEITTSTVEEDNLQKKNVPEDNYQPATPEKGTRTYNRYLRRNLKYPDNAKENSIEGSVVLQVVIDENGSISGIEITESLGFGCDKEAIRLIKDGPKWTPAKKEGLATRDTVMVTVPFKL